MPQDKLPHILLAIPPERREFTSIQQGGSNKDIPERDRDSHAEYLHRKLQEAWQEAENEIAVSHADRQGVYIEFKGKTNYDLVTKSLEDLRSKKIRLCNIRTEIETVCDEQTGENKKLSTLYATVFVSKSKQSVFFKKIEQYANEDVKRRNPQNVEEENRHGKPKNADLVNSIEDIRKALLIESFWVDDKSLIPNEIPQWCEVWLRSSDQEALQRFEQLLNQQHINSKIGVLQFPERIVKMIYANCEQLRKITTYSDDVAEFRRAKETANFWTSLSSREQAEWVDNLTQRLQVNQDSLVSICLLDKGINNGHPLLRPLLHDDDCHSIDESWGTHDHDRHGHGTLMAGIAAYGDLAIVLSRTSTHRQEHLLESVKMLPPTGNNERELWGYITSQAISRAEIQAPHRKRIVCMAVTAEDTRDRGRPTSWSGAIDQLASGTDEEIRRLIVVSGGNVTDDQQITNYPYAQETDSIHDPAQSWNALTIGAYTQLDNLTDPELSGYRCVAPRDCLSPFSTTSTMWDDKWPIKPEVVMEGGNIAVSGDFHTECSDLSVLSTYCRPQDRLFDYFNMTSAATAQAAWFAARIQAQYPEYWPETIRGLIVHSAIWPEALKRQFIVNDSKAEMKKLLRICGYGVPQLDRALYSASNSLTLISQTEIQPFERRDGRYRTCDMHIYELPWPREILEELGDTPVRMRVTLSYFIEPGPGEIGWKDRYRYASHALRFDLNSPDESRDQFIRRINVAARDEENGHPGTNSVASHWVLGKQSRDKGSIHSDIWQGTAPELAASNIVAIYPSVGWWRERKHLGKYEKSTRYSLVISLTTPEQDIYTSVAQQVGIVTPITIRI